MENLYKYISFDGYRNDSPDRYNPVNIIPTGRISMRDVNYPVFGIDEYGNGGIMYPGNDYQFTGNTVLEIPMMQRGGQPVYDNIPSPAVMRSKAQADHEADIVLRQKALQPITKPVIDFMQEWMSSPMYKAMLQKSNGSSIAKGREKQLQTMRAPGSFNIDVDLNPYHDWVDNFFVPRTLGSYGINTLTGENKIYIDKKETDPKRRKEIAVHELSHATDNPNGAGGTPLLPAADIAKMQAYRAAFDKTRKSKPEDWQTEFYNYLAEPTETRARLNTLRYLGKQKGIYDPFTEKIDKNKLDKFNSLFSNDISLRQLREIYSDEQITDMLNSISKVPSVSSIPLAKGGGQHGGLDRWFAEKWVDVKTGKECGRQEGEKRKGYPACRPSKRVSTDTPKTASELSSAEKARFKREKTSSKRISYNHKKEEGGELELAQYGYMIPPAGFNLMLGASELYNYFFGDEPKEVSKPQVKNVSPMGSMYQLYNADLNQFKSQKTNNDKLNQNNSGNINLSSGRFQGAQVSPEVIKEAVASAKAQGIDPWLMLSVIGRESTFGSGTDANIKRAGSKSKLVSGWDVAENYTPYDPLRFLADKKVPGVSTTRDAHGWHYKLDDKAALNKYLSQHPELVAQYQKKVESTPELGNLDSFDLAAKFIKERGLARYNPGDPNYSSMVNQDMKLLQSDPKLKAYMKTLGYENGGELFDMKSGGNVPTNPSLWSKAKAAAKAKYDVYPSAYANGFAAKWYKQRGGSWKKAAEGGCFECGGQFAEGGVNYNDMLNQPVFIPTNFVQFGGVANPLKQLQNMDTGDKIQLAKLAMMFAKDGGEADGGMALTQVNAMIDRLNNLKNFITLESDLDPWISDKISVMNHSATAINDYMQYGEQEEPEEMREGGGIPTRYKNMGFSKVGVKKESSRPGKKWMVLAKKGDDYKVVHGGYDGMKDFSQHGSEKRKDRFWDRMGGKDSAKAKDPFSPLYWHKKFGTWAEGGEPQNEGFQALPEEVQNKILKRMIGGGEEGDWMTIGKTTNRNIAAYQDKPTRSMVNFGANTTLNPTLYAIEGMDDKGFFGDLAAIALGAGALNNVGLGYRKLLGPASKTQTQMNTRTGKMVTSNLMDRDSKKLMNQWEKPEFYQEPVQDELRRKQKMNLSVPPTGVDTIPMDSFENMAKYGGYYVSKMLTGGQPMLSKDEWMQQNGRGLMGQELQDEKDYQAYVQQWQLENENSTTQQTPATTTTTTPEVTTRLGKSKMIPNLELDPEGQALAYGTISAISTIANRKNRKDTLKEYEANLQKYGNTDFRFDNNYVNRDMFGQYTTNRAQGQNFILNKTTYAQDMGNQFNYGFGTNFKEGGEYDLTPQQIAAIMAAGGEIEFID